MNKKYILLALPMLLLSSCGESCVFDAAKITTTPIKEEKTVKVRYKMKRYPIRYFNVYNDGNDNFVLKDDSSYIIAPHIAFGMKFTALNARAYYVSDDEKNGQECAPLFDEEDDISGETKYYKCWGYSYFEVRIDKSTPGLYTDVNIGKITQWC